MIRRPPRSTLFPTRRSSDLSRVTVKTPLRVWKRTGHVVWFRSVSTWADANVACPQRSISTSRSEEHTSELQSQSNLVCRLLLEKQQSLHQSLHGTSTN